VAAPKSGAANADAMIYALEKIVSTTGAAGSSGTVSASDAWSGALATFKAATSSTLALTGAAAANYTLAGLSGSVVIAPKALAASGLAASDRAYDGTSVAVLAGTAALLPAGAPGEGTSGDGKPYTGDPLALGGAAAGTFADPDVGSAKGVTVTGLILTGEGSGNYTLTPPAGLTADITPALTTITAAPSATPITYGQTLASSTLNGGAGSVPGSFSFTAPATAPAAGMAPHGVTFTPGDTTNYQASSTSVEVTVQAAVANFATWAADPANGLTAGVNDGALDDPDHDGILNLMEYALNTAPIQANPIPVTHDFLTVGADRFLRLNAVKNPAAADLDYIIEVSGDLVANSWTAVPTVADGNDLSGTDTLAVTSSGHRFIRLRVRVRP
jgi:hypothetical protein